MVLCIGIFEAAVHEKKWSPYGSSMGLRRQVHG